jgi:hypothetical protein
LGKEVFEGAYQVDDILSLVQEFDKHEHIAHDHIDRFVSNIREKITITIDK